MNLSNSEHENATIVVPDGRLDGTDAPTFESYCTALIADGKTRLLIDMANVEYISSAGLRSLLVLAKAIQAAQGKIVLCSLTPMVKEVMEISCFDKMLTMADHRDAAMILFG